MDTHYATALTAVDPLVVYKKKVAMAQLAERGIDNAKVTWVTITT